MEEKILLAVADGVATITLNRPRSGNALDLDGVQALLRAVNTVDHASDVRCVVLTGSGTAFCTGGDVKGFAESGDGAPAFLKETTVYLHAAASQLCRMDKPLITAVNGAAAGAGLGLALLGDVVLMADTAYFTTAYSKIGLTPDGGVSWLLPRLVGLRAAQEMILTSRKVPAAEAMDRGMVTRVVAFDELAGEAQELARRLGDLNTPAVGEIRNLLLSSFGASFETQLELEARSISRMSGTAYSRNKTAEFGHRTRPGSTIDD